MFLKNKSPMTGIDPKTGTESILKVLVNWICCTPWIILATKIAKDMVTVYGMSDTVGPICLKQKEPYENRILGENIDDVIVRWIKFKKNGNKIYVYKPEEETKDGK